MDLDVMSIDIPIYYLILNHLYHTYVYHWNTRGNPDVIGSKLKNKIHIHQIEGHNTHRSIYDTHTPN